MIGGDGLADRPGSKAGRFRGFSRYAALSTAFGKAADGQIEYLGRSDARFMHSGRSFDPAETERVCCGMPRSATRFVPAARGRIADRLRGARSPRTMAMPRSSSPCARTWRITCRITWFRPRGRARDLAAPCGWIRRPHRASRRQEPVVRGASSGQPSGDVERRLAELWKTMLGIDSVDPAIIFELGGHSLLAARMLTRVEREFGAASSSHPVSRPTLHDLPRSATDRFARIRLPAGVKIQPHGSKRPLIAINNTGIYYGLARAWGRKPVYSCNCSIVGPGLGAADFIGGDRAGYVGLIRRVQPKDLRFDRLVRGGGARFEIARQLLAQKQAVSRLFLIDSWLRTTSRAFRPGADRGRMDDARAARDGGPAAGAVQRQVALEFVTRRTLFMRLQRSSEGPAPIGARWWSRTSRPRPRPTTSGCSPICSS